MGKVRGGTGGRLAAETELVFRFWHVLAVLGGYSHTEPEMVSVETTIGS